MTKTPWSRNVYSEKSKADDVQFILDLITKIAEEIPAADMNNVNIAGSSNRNIFVKAFQNLYIHLIICQAQAMEPP